MNYVSVLILDYLLIDFFPFFSFFLFLFFLFLFRNYRFSSFICVYLKQQQEVRMRGYSERCVASACRLKIVEKNKCFEQNKT